MANQRITPAVELGMALAKAKEVLDKARTHENAVEVQRIQRELREVSKLELVVNG